MPPKRNPLSGSEIPTKKLKKSNSDDEKDKEKDKKTLKSSSSITSTDKKKKVVTYDSEDAESESDIDPDDYKDDYVRWYWAGDSGGGPQKGGGHQDIWVEYDKIMCLRIERALNNLKPKLKVDKERFIDLKNMLQRRRDDPNKRRMIKRQDKNKKNQKITKKKKKGVKDDSEDDSESESKKKKSVNVPNALAIFRPPAYWDPQPDTSYNEKELEVTSVEFQKIRDTFVSSIADYHKNSKSVHKIVFSTYQVTKVIRIQNPVLWLRYITRKDQLKNDLKGKMPVIPKVKTGEPLDSEVNEYHLYHGLNSSFITGITKFGFDPRFCSLQGMFGAGLYFAENSSKSNQYVHSGACTCVGPSATTSCRCTQTDEYSMLVCRVALGDILIEQQHRGNLQGQFWYGRRTEPTKPDGKSIYNSVLGESKEHYPMSSLLLREYIVYESSQVYPEYIIHYRRVK
eukprot:TRINITY_DN2017_c0_g1_i1.p1 TRINITY_DN2017_c0_g1~~TRINITY_DN2017_c0_g1_i1.p1  ORF type:complete len:455 (+),score=99.16 TRINITY_DN2017_c0_g1_i1:55-1419(+)